MTIEQQVDAMLRRRGPSKAQYEAAAPILAELDAASDEGGTIQCALEIMPHEHPEWHRTQSYATAAHRLGLEQDEHGQWYMAKVPQ